MGIQGQQYIPYSDVFAFCDLFPKHERSNAQRCAEMALEYYWPESGFLGRLFSERWLDTNYQLIKPVVLEPESILVMRHSLEGVDDPNMRDIEWGALIIEGAIGCFAFPYVHVSSY